MSSRSHGRDPRPVVYFALAGLFALISVTAFIPSYFMKVGNHTFTSPPIYHVHATLFFGWILLNLTQAWLVATGRTYDHRRWGLLGIALATTMAISIVLMVITSIRFSDAHGAGLPVRRFSYLNISGVIKFSLFFAAAIFFVQRREIHKRYVVGFILTFGTGLLIPFVSRTDAWLATINRLVGLLG